MRERRPTPNLKRKRKERQAKFIPVRKAGSNPPSDGRWIGRGKKRPPAAKREADDGR